MSYIACISDCVYQKDGVCCLERAASVNSPISKSNACIHYIKKKQEQRKQTKIKAHTYIASYIYYLPPNTRTRASRTVFT